MTLAGITGVASVAGLAVDAVSSLLSKAPKVDVSSGSSLSTNMDGNIAAYEGLMQEQAKLQFQLQRLSLLSNSQKSDHEAKMSVINNTRTR